MVRKKRDWHPKFKKYMKFIVNHPNYKGMPFLYKENGKIRWIVERDWRVGNGGIKKEKSWDYQKVMPGFQKPQEQYIRLAKNHVKFAEK